MQIEGTAAVVTGAASGLGAATARGLAAAGARVGLLDYDGAGARAVADEIGGHACAVDVGDEAAVAAAMDEIAGALGGLRIAVNCAGIGEAARVVARDGTLGTALFERTIRVNLMGSYFVMAHAARAMMQEAPLETGERGVVINTASIAFQDGQIGQTAYSASKGGIAALTLPAAREMARQGVRVMAIAPGLFETPMMQGLPEETTAGIVANIPFPHRLGDPAEFALLVRQIVGNPYLNGEVIRLDAGVRLPQR